MHSAARHLDTVQLVSQNCMPAMSKMQPYLPHTHEYAIKKAANILLPLEQLPGISLWHLPAVATMQHGRRVDQYELLCERFGMQRVAPLQYLVGAACLRLCSHKAGRPAITTLYHPGCPPLLLQSRTWLFIARLLPEGVLVQVMCQQPQLRDLCEVHCGRPQHLKISVGSLPISTDLPCRPANGHNLSSFTNLANTSV